MRGGRNRGGRGGRRGRGYRNNSHEENSYENQEDDNENNSSFRSRGNRYSRRGDRSFRGNYYKNDSYSHENSSHTRQSEYNNLLSSREFNQIVSEFPNLPKPEIRNAEAALKGKNEMFREIIMRNLCCKAEYVFTFLHNRRSDKSEEHNENLVFQECGQFELDIHKKYITTYKTEKCKENKHSSECFGFHDKKDQRRKPLIYSNNQWNYYPIKCGIEGCFLASCEYSHNQYEIDYHPLVYKSEMCGYDSNDGFRCEPLSERCPKAHGINDLRKVPENIEKLKQNSHLLIVAKKPGSGYERIQEKIVPQVEVESFSIETYKTMECPDIDDCDNINCLYFHSDLEKRRNCTQFNYKNTMCPAVFIDGKYQDPSNCYKGEKCEYCHTKNEFYYHPQNYRKKACPRQNCKYGEFCPDIHFGTTLHEIKENSESSHSEDQKEKSVDRKEKSLEKFDENKEKPILNEKSELKEKYEENIKKIEELKNKNKKLSKEIVFFYRI